MSPFTRPARLVRGLSARHAFLTDALPSRGKQLPRGLQLDGKSQHPLLQGSIFRGIARYRARLLSKLIDFKSPSVLMGFLAQLRPLCTGEVVIGCLFCGEHSRLKLGDICRELWSCGLAFNDRFVAPYLIDALGLAGGAVTLHEDPTEGAAAGPSAGIQELATGGAYLGVQEASVHFLTLSRGVLKGNMFPLT